MLTILKLLAINMKARLNIAKAFFREKIDQSLGVIAAFSIFGTWLLTFYLVLGLDLGQMPWLGILATIVGRTFLHTGLFIISHDAAHGNVYNGDRHFNDQIGAIALAIYGLLPYQKFVINHGLHHQHPGTSQDPDFHDGKHTTMMGWYLRFMGRYLDKTQNLVLLVGMTVLFHGVRIGFHVPAANLLLFWILPLLLSSMQLFYFGTYLPHRLDLGGDRHNAVSSNLPVWLSFFSCYHFGYHWEHHEYPRLPWFKLPLARKLL